MLLKGGKQMKVKFYYCPHCHNLIYMAIDSGVNPYCCNEPMKELKANTSDVAFEKHVPVVNIDEATRQVHIKVGSLPHPMLDNHHIVFIGISTNRGIRIFNVKDFESAEISFYLDEDEKLDRVYEYCNLHGLWCDK